MSPTCSSSTYNSISHVLHIGFAFDSHVLHIVFASDSHVFTCETVENVMKGVTRVELTMELPVIVFLSL